VERRAGLTLDALIDSMENVERVGRALAAMLAV
jgi:hypothetical protein